MNVDQALERIEALSDPRALAVWERMSISPERYLGASLTKLQALAKEIKRDHILALALWDTCIHDAKLLATMIEEPKRVDAAQIERQTQKIYSTDLADKYVTNIIAKTPYVQHFLDAWLHSENEMLRRSAYTLLLAQAKNDRELPDSYFLQHLAVIERDLQREQNWVKEMMNYVVIGIGSRTTGLREQALQAAQHIGVVAVDYGDTSCKTTDATAALNSPRLLASFNTSPTLPI